MHPDLYDTDDLAAGLGVHPLTLRRWVASGRIPGAQIGRRWRFWGPAVIKALFPDADLAAAGSTRLPHRAQTSELAVEPVVVNARTLAELLDLRLSTTTALIRQGAIAGTKVGREWLVHWPSLRDHIAAGSSQATEALAGAPIADAGTAEEVPVRPWAPAGGTPADRDTDGP
ncbi:helix-turn-helix domain-containing protein [Pseudokineococcus sp. 1T1Z-3]|uniref:helix-turn-helix domain-containing protein n=1 Tax=Pseudokineococcus sp. 1T1Z-3 TaxID=3132745 RepID=UPI0030A80673